MACVSAAVQDFASATSSSTTSTTLLSPMAQLKARGVHIAHHLGRGVHGRVDLARDDTLSSTHPKVAVKWPVLPVHAVYNWDAIDEQMAALAQEAEALQHVQHQHVISLKRVVHGRFRRRSFCALVLEHAQHGDFFDLIASTGALPEAIAKVYFAQLVQAVAACHAHGVVHRDIKLENLLLDAEFNLKLADFSSATVVVPAWKHADDAVFGDCNGENGTTEYLAPEVDDDTRQAPYRATPVDVWACGVVLFMLLTAARPFAERHEGNASYAALIRGDLAAFWRSQPSVLPTLSEAAKDLISQLLCVDPTKRISLSTVLKHPWLQDVETLDREELWTIMNQRTTQSTDTN